LASELTRSALIALFTLGCGSEPLARYPVSGPMLKDPDLRPVNFPCRPDKGNPNRTVCRPREYRSSLWWDGADQSLFRPMSHFFAVQPGGEAANVNSLDELPDSSWFTNRIGSRPFPPSELARGYCAQTPALPVDLPDGSWVIDRGKGDGATPGFRIDVKGVGKFSLKSDDFFSPEKASAAEAIVSRLYYAAGYSVPCYFVVYFRPSLLKLTPGLTYRTNIGRVSPFDAAALDRLLARLPRRGELVRMGVSVWLPGRTLGPFTYQGTRDDDPRDVVPHEDRRDLRAMRLLASWVNHFDSREENSMETWVTRADDEDASPGFVQRWLLDFGDCLGSQWTIDEFARRLGHSFYFDPGYILADWFTFGLIERPWDRAYSLDYMFPYFRSDNFVPERWKTGYPNPAFARMTEVDAAWMARIIARFTPEHLQAAIAAGKFSGQSHADLLFSILLERRRRILKRYLERVSPIGALEVRGNELCGIDFARSSGVFEAPRFRYAASLFYPAPARALAARASADGRVCVSLPESPTQADETGYFALRMTNGQARGELRAFLYKLDDGYRLAGIERPEP